MRDMIKGVLIGGGIGVAWGLFRVAQHLVDCEISRRRATRDLRVFARSMRATVDAARGQS